ncbi:MAG: glycosyltransferase [Cellulosilyticaceae bacterium]
MGTRVLFMMYQLGRDGVTNALKNTIRGLRRCRGITIELWVMVKTDYVLERDIPARVIYQTEGELWGQIAQGNRQLYIGEQFDYMIAYSCMLAAELLANTPTTAKKIAWLHTDIKQLTRHYSKQHIKAVYRRIDEIVCVSHGVLASARNYLEPEDEYHLRVIYNPINKQVISAKSVETLESVLEGVVVLAVGRLSEEKGLERLIAIHARLLQEGIHHQLIIIGEGELRAALEAFIIQKGVCETCQLVGYQTNPYKWLRRAELVVSTSYVEGLPLSMMEAMVLCKPIVATKVIGNEELLMDERGLLVESTEEAIYKGLRRLLVEPQSRQAYAERLEAISTFPFEEDVVIGQMMELLSGR